MGTTLHFLNHASVIIEYNDGQNQQMVMTDPWFQQPAFGSWLPNPPTAFHPALLASLSYDHPNFSFLISHGHDDHFDDQWLKLFNKDIRIFTANYDAPSVRNRLKALGFHNVVEVTPELSVHDLFRIRCFINTDVSNDDSLYTITTPDSMHCACERSVVPTEGGSGFDHQRGNRHGSGRAVGLHEPVQFRVGLPDDLSSDRGSVKNPDGKGD
ncbi:Putative Rieske 2Fe-2S iron-sulfur protein [Gimesia panareensis]|uniref:Rieske 2Fe-2S iron-sulfur protein n=1 Tax=Gimesia panareensis TaxID=2527978 RepID=A0A518FWA6_9PLAN|nr:MBL fold metallo-hydrolase [Gimesia panareensis]QDV20647.1 Putative Rieske 2Fe-2S iron-sulfur protein [Gimesia panareensis]